MDKRFLVVVHAGPASRHGQWLQTASARNWDLIVCHDGPQAPTPARDGVAHIARAGTRWQALAQVLTDARDAWRAYEHVWLPADDLDITGDDIGRLFEIAAALRLPLAQPALATDGPAVSPLARALPGFSLRFASFVDSAAPLFSSALLERALPTLADGDPATLGQRWPRLLADPARECAIVDRVVARRTAATAPAPRAGGLAPIRLCYGGFDADGHLHHLFDAADDGFLTRLAGGLATQPGLAATERDALLEEHRAARRDVVPAAPAAAAAARDAFTVTIGTSIAPQGEAKQQRAIASWRALGFEVVSFNIAAEISQLKDRYPGVQFVEVTRDGRERTGKPLVYVDDVFAWFRDSGLPYGGFVNSDIVLRPADGAGFMASLRTNMQGAMVFGRRVEVDTLDQLDGDYYMPGFDIWFWDRCVLESFRQSTDYFVGFPHWDYYAVLMPLLHGFPIRQFAVPVAYHETHRMYYDVVRDGIPYGLKTFKIVAPLIPRIPAQNHQITPVLDFFLKHQPGAMKRPEDIEYYHAMLHALDLWFLDVIDRNSEKIRVLDGRAAERDGVSIPFAVAVTPPATGVAASRTTAPRAPLEISVIVPTFNRAAILERCLQHLAAQTIGAERFEVIVVDDGSTDDTAQVLAAAGDRLRLVHEKQANLGPASARNRALKRARGRWVLFLNDDALLEPRALEIHLEEHARRGPKAAVLGAFPLHPDFTPTDRPMGWCLDHSDLIFAYIHLAPGRAIGHEHFYTCNLSLSREFLLAHGGFEEGFVRMGAEDIELGRRLQRDGCEVWYRPDCVARHAHRLDVDGLARMYQFRGRGGVHLFVREPAEQPHYTTMPVQRADELLALHERLTPLLDGLRAAIERMNALPCVAVGRGDTIIDERTSGIDFRMLWQWPDGEIRRMIGTLTASLERQADRLGAQPAPSLEEAAVRLYPALQFVKWYYDTLGVVSSSEIRGYLASRQPVRAVALQAA